MRESISQHCFSSQPLGTTASGVWAQGIYPVNPNLKDLFDRILQKVSAREQQGDEDNGKAGKKRAASPIFLDKVKKRRLSINSGCATTEENLDNSFPLFPFPPVPTRPSGEKTQPIWNHTFSVRYANDCDGPLCRELRDTLDTLCGSFSEPTTIDVGHIQILHFDQRLFAVWGLPFHRSDGRSCLVLTFPDKDQEYVAILRSCYELRQVHKVEIRPRMKVIIQPRCLNNTAHEQLPFEIQIEVTVSFCLSSLFEPLPRRETKKRVRFIEECQMHLYRFLYDRSSGQDTNIPHTIDIPYFYSILTSAPPMQSRLADDALQPEALLPGLLPFQRRSVAWLLGREGRELTAEGNIVPKADDPEYGFWDEIQEGNHTLFYNRLSGMLSPDKPVMEKALGGILAEEPGLGKTLETLALILLNPAPADRNPSLIRWDPEARLNVKAVKVLNWQLSIPHSFDHFT